MYQVTLPDPFQPIFPQKRKNVSNDQNYVSKYAKMFETGPSPFLVDFINNLEINLPDLAPVNQVVKKPLDSSDTMYLLKLNNLPKVFGQNLPQSLTNSPQLLTSPPQLLTNSPELLTKPPESLTKLPKSLSTALVVEGQDECHICHELVWQSEMRLHTTIKHDITDKNTGQEQEEQEEQQEHTMRSDMFIKDEKVKNEQIRRNEERVTKCEPLLKSEEVIKKEKCDIYKARVAGRVYSNDLSEEVETLCKICSKTVRVSKMRHHTVNTHKINIKTYKERFGNHKQDLVREVYHKCGICEVDILLDSDYIKNHSYDIHGVKQSVYNAEFLVPRKNKNGKVYALKQKPLSTPASVLDTLEEIENIVNKF